MNNPPASARADAHIHLFDPGFAQGRPAECRQVQPNEVTLYNELARRHQIEAALVVAYEGDDWAHGNNDYLASIATDFDWLYPVAYCHDPRELTTTQLESYAAQGFVGISLYLFPPEGGSTKPDPRLVDADSTIWQWLAEHNWLISVNSSGSGWETWAQVLQTHPQLRVMASHLGLPPRLPAQTTPDVVAENLAPILELAPFPNVVIKVSGLYALSEPGYAFPHASAWPYIQTLLAAFGVERLVWGSDFTPALDSVSFVQTVHVLDAMPFLTTDQRTAIQSTNLMRLLHAVQPSARRGKSGGTIATEGETK